MDRPRAWKVASLMLAMAPLVLVFLPALTIVLWMGFWRVEHFQLAPALDVSAWRQALSQPSLRIAAWSTIGQAVPLSLAITAVAWPVAVLLRLGVAGGRAVVATALFLLLVPLLSNGVLRAYTWQLWLGTEGIGSALVASLTGHIPTSLGLNTRWGTFVGWLSAYLPLGTLISYVSLGRADRTHLLAARNLGASWFLVLVRVVLPLSLPGVTATVVVSFVLAVGDPIGPSILGGGQDYTLSLLLLDRVKVNDWPGAAIVATVMLGFGVAAAVLGAVVSWLVRWPPRCVGE